MYHALCRDLNLSNKLQSNVKQLFEKCIEINLKRVQTRQTGRTRNKNKMDSRFQHVPCHGETQ